MRLLDSSFEIIEQTPGLKGVYKQIEKAARTAYKSEDKITDDSASRMVESLIKRGHGACLEHGTIYLKMTYDLSAMGSYYHSGIDKYVRNPYSKVIFDDECDFRTAYITTNARVIEENDWQEDLQYMCEPTGYHEKRITVKFTTSIGIVRELLRHRVFSFLNESTRYCNYSSDKFNNELTFIIPEWVYDIQAEVASYRNIRGELMDWLMEYRGEELIHELEQLDERVAVYYDSLDRAEQDYNFLVNNGLKAQEARSILPLDTKSELIMTGFPVAAI